MTAECPLYESCYVFDQECAAEPEGGLVGRFKCSLEDPDFQGLSDISGTLELGDFGTQYVTLYGATYCSVNDTEDLGRLLVVYVQSNTTYTYPFRLSAVIPFDEVDDGGRYEVVPGQAILQTPAADGSFVSLAQVSGGEYAVEMKRDFVEGYVEITMEPAP